LVDDADLWCQSYDRAAGDAVVLLGSSRIQLGVDPNRLAELLSGREVVQLAVDGRAPFAALDALAQREDFIGLTLLSVVESSLTEKNWAGQAEYVSYCQQQWSFDRRVHRRIATARQERFASANPNVSLLRVLQSWISAGRLPPPLWLHTYPDRSRAVDPQRIDFARLTEWRLERLRKLYAEAGPVDEAEWFSLADRLRDAIERLQRRGARVVLLRLPTCGEHWRLDEERYPRARFWDRLVERSGAPGIHFLDVPEMAALPCYDGSHLDRPNARRYTEALAGELERRNIR
jgi:diadenosine tetraphosphatase ApaH/serine/threonine PP2A family protein phosphatase